MFSFYCCGMLLFLVIFFFFFLFSAAIFLNWWTDSMVVFARQLVHRDSWGGGVVVFPPAPQHTGTFLLGLVCAKGMMLVLVLCERTCCCCLAACLVPHVLAYSWLSLLVFCRERLCQYAVWVSTSCLLVMRALVRSFVRVPLCRRGKGCCWTDVLFVGLG